MNHLGNWILGAVTTIMAVCGLFVAARAGHGVTYYGGLLFSAFAVCYVFYLIRVSYDRHEG